jgi:hypothetical protein
VRDRVFTCNKVCRCGDSCAGSTREEHSTRLFGGTLRVRTSAVRLCGSGSAGLVAAYQRTHSALLRSKPQKRPLSRDDARAAQAAPSTVCFAGARRKQTHKKTTKQPNKRTA